MNKIENGKNLAANRIRAIALCLLLCLCAISAVACGVRGGGIRDGKFVPDANDPNPYAKILVASIVFRGNEMTFDSGGGLGMTTTEKYRIVNGVLETSSNNGATWSSSLFCKFIDRDTVEYLGITYKRK